MYRDVMFRDVMHRDVIRLPPPAAANYPPPTSRLPPPICRWADRIYPGLHRQRLVAPASLAVATGPRCHGAIAQVLLGDCARRGVCAAKVCRGGAWGCSESSRSCHDCRRAKREIRHRRGPRWRGRMRPCQPRSAGRWGDCRCRCCLPCWSPEVTECCAVPATTARSAWSWLASSQERLRRSWCSTRLFGWFAASTGSLVPLILVGSRVREVACQSGAYRYVRSCSCLKSLQAQEAHVACHITRIQPLRLRSLILRIS
jgi:hypothetical protein